MGLSKDLHEFVELLSASGAEFVVVGSYARAFYAEPRYTADIDFFVRCSKTNAETLTKLLNDFGFESFGISADQFYDPDIVIQLGREPNRIDLITKIDGVTFEEAWAEKVAGEIDGIPVYFISRRLFIKNKLAAGRAKDLADAEAVGNDPSSTPKPEL